MGRREAPERLAIGPDRRRCPGRPGRCAAARSASATAAQGLRVCRARTHHLGVTPRGGTRRVHGGRATRRRRPRHRPPAHRPGARGPRRFHRRSARRPRLAAGAGDPAHIDPDRRPHAARGRAARRPSQEDTAVIAPGAGRGFAGDLGRPGPPPRFPSHTRWDDGSRGPAIPVRRVLPRSLECVCANQSRDAAPRRDGGGGGDLGHVPRRLGAEDRRAVRRDHRGGPQAERQVPRQLGGLQRAKAAGYETYDMWGLPNEGITYFKAGWGGRQVDYVEGRDLIVDPLGARIFETAVRARGVYRAAAPLGPSARAVWRHRKPRARSARPGRAGRGGAEESGCGTASVRSIPPASSSPASRTTRVGSSRATCSSRFAGCAPTAMRS